MHIVTISIGGYVYYVEYCVEGAPFIERHLASLRALQKKKKNEVRDPPKQRSKIAE